VLSIRVDGFILAILSPVLAVVLLGYLALPPLLFRLMAQASIAGLLRRNSVLRYLCQRVLAGP